MEGRRGERRGGEGRGEAHTSMILLCVCAYLPTYCTIYLQSTTSTHNHSHSHPHAPAYLTYPSKSSFTHASSSSSSSSSLCRAVQRLASPTIDPIPLHNHKQSQAQSRSQWIATGRYDIQYSIQFSIQLSIHSFFPARSLTTSDKTQRPFHPCYAMLCHRIMYPTLSLSLTHKI